MKCNICGKNIISEFESSEICNICHDSNAPFISYQFQQFLVAAGYMIVGGIYLYGGFYANDNHQSIFENPLYWFLVDFFGLYIIYIHNFTKVQDFMKGSVGVGSFFAVPAVTIIGLLNLFSPEFVSIFFWDFPTLNILTGITCLWTGFSNITGKTL